MNEYFAEIEREQLIVNQRKIYENMQHLSKNEKNNFENKFTRPKNPHQEEYVAHLKNKTKKS